MNNPLSNIWKYTIFLITNKRVYVAIIAIYYLTIPGVNEIGISYILLAGNIAGFVFEIPSGYLADIIGHKKTLVLSRIFAIISSIFYLVAGNIWALIVGSIFLSISVAFTSGTGNAFMQETLKAAKKQDEYANIMGKVKSLGFLIPLIISSLVPFLALISIKGPFVIGLIMDIVGFLIAISFVNPNIQQDKIKEFGLGNILKVISEGYNLGFIRYTVYTGVMGGLLFAIGSYRGPYQMSAGAPIIYFGLFFALGRVFASVLLWFSGTIQRVFTMKQFFFTQALLYTLIFLILGVTNNLWVAILLFAIQNGLKWGLTEIEDSYFINIISNSKFKATLLSVGAQIQQLIGGVAGLLVGRIIFTYGYEKGFFVFSLIFSGIMLTLYFLTFWLDIRKKVI